MSANAAACFLAGRKAPRAGPHCFALILGLLSVAVFSSSVGAAAGPTSGTSGDPLPPSAIARFGTLHFQHGAKIRAVAWSRDGRFIATAGASDGRPTIRIWEAATGRELVGIDAPRTDCFSLSFSADGKTLAFAGEGAVRVYDVRTGRELQEIVPADPRESGQDRGRREGDEGREGKENKDRVDKEGGPLRPPRAGKGPPTCAAFSPDGRLLASAHSNQVLISDTATFKPVHRLPAGSNLAWSPDGKLLAVATGPRGPILIWDANSGREVRPLGDEGDGFLSAAFSHDGNYLVGASAAGDKRVGWAHVWDVRTGQEIRRFAPRKGSFQCIACSPTANVIALCHYDGLIALHDLTDGNELRRLQGHAGWVRSAAFSPDGNTLASGGWDRVVHLWDVHTGIERIEEYGHRGGVSSACFSQDHRSITTGGQDGTVRLWDLGGNQLKVLRGEGNTVYAAEVSPDGRFLASCPRDGPVRLWESPWDKDPRVWRREPGELSWTNAPASAPSAAPELAAPIGAQGVSERWLKFDPAGKRLFTVGSTGRISVLELPGGAVGGPASSPAASPCPAAETQRGAEAGSDPAGPAPVLGLASVDFSFDARLVAMGAAGAAFVKELPTGRELAAIRSANPGFTRSVSLSPYADVLACGISDGLCLVEIESGAEITRIPLNLAYAEQATTAFSFDCSLLAAGTGEGLIIVFDTMSARELLRLEGHRGGVTALRFSRDGKLLLSASADGTAVLWSLAKLPAADPIPQRLTERRDLKALWEALADKDARRAQEAVRALARRGDEAAAFLKDLLKPAAAEDADRVKRLVDDLDHPRYTARQAAFEAIARLGALAEPQLRDALKDAKNTETKERVNTLLKALVAPELRNAELLRIARAIAALERIDSPAARKLLEALTQGADAARSTQQAKAALARMDARRAANRGP